LRAGSSSLRIVSEATFAERIAAPLAKPRFGAALFATFGFVTLGLCVVGIYGVIASAVNEREAEFGIRLALGEQPHSVAMRVGQYGAALTLTGVGFGLALAALGTRMLRSVLFGVQPTDPTTFAAVAGITIVAAAVSCFIPAMRVARLSPMSILRQGAT
jgi:ABC-type antimicrobial peptide transport system permease subunit